jgi:hypothetical protein
VLGRDAGNDAYDSLWTESPDTLTLVPKTWRYQCNEIKWTDTVESLGMENREIIQHIEL